MRDWKQIKYTNTFKELVDLSNANTDSSAFLDEMTGTILCNGVLFSGIETVDGMLTRPLKSVELSGVVKSDTIFDNFVLYFRDTNNLKELNKFPVDLLSYANGKPQFLYIKEDLTYRISDYMFGAADEVLLARFVINTNSTWNQMYIMSQRAGTPMYNAADEFYTVDGMYVKSPGGLELSQTSGTVKRSGIDFADKVSPDLYQFYNLASERLPIRYVNTDNEIDYTVNPTYEIQPNKYMIYNMNKELKIDAEDYIREIKNLYYMIKERSTAAADELHEAIVVGGDLSDLTQIVKAYTDNVDIIYAEVTKLYNLLGNSTLSSVRRAALKDNQDLVTVFMNKYLKGEAIATEITETQVTAIRNFPAFIYNISSTICSKPLENALQEVQDGLDDITFNKGEIKSVTKGKFTVQRVLWDVYEQTLILQYGNKVYDNFNAAIEGTGLLDYPAPFGKTIYIPLAIIVLKAGITSLNEDAESIIIDRRWIEVDQEQSGYADYVARAKADKALNQIIEILKTIDTIQTNISNIISGVTPVGKSNTLKCTVNNTTVYKDGNYYLNYDNLNNKITVINNLTSSSYNSKQALSAYQGKVLNDAKLNLSGGTMTGTLNARNIIPSAASAYDLGSSSMYWKQAYLTNATISNSLVKYSNGSTYNYLYTGNNSMNNIRAMSKSSADNSWGSLPNGTLVFCW